MYNDCDMSYIINSIRTLNKIQILRITVELEIKCQ